MKPFSFFLNESFSYQIKYYLDNNYSKDEFKSILKATPIALLDGLMSMSVTTKEKPLNTNPSSLEQTSIGWVSIYKKN